jgi:hypothetical protein
MAKLNEAVNASIHEERMLDPKTYRVHGIWAICNARLSLVDNECIAWINPDSIKLDAYGENKLERTFDIMPSFTFTFTLDELRQYQLEPITLAKFMENANMNKSRIQDNLRQYLRWVNGNESK